MKQQTASMTYPSMSATAGALKVPLAKLRQLKKLGADGFDPSGRVHAGKLLAWLLRQGDKGKVPAISLEQARAGLAEAQTAKLKREEALSGGRLAPIGWFVECVETFFERPVFTQWLIDERIPKLLYFVRDTTDRSEGERFLREDAKSIMTVIKHAKNNMLDAIRRGPDGEGNIYGDTVRLLKDTAESLSPDARKEMHAALSRTDGTIQAKRGAGERSA